MRIQLAHFPALILLLSFLPATPGVAAQDRKISKNDVPAPVLEAFARAYPHATIRGTSTEVENGRTYYEIESLDGTQARDILYLPDGTAAEIEEVVAATALPAPVKRGVENEFAKAKIAKAEKVTKGTQISYEVHVSQGSKTGSIVVDPSGKVLKKSPLSEKKQMEEHEDEEDD